MNGSKRLAVWITAAVVIAAIIVFERVTDHLDTYGAFTRLSIAFSLGVILGRHLPTNIPSWPKPKRWAAAIGCWICIGFLVISLDQTWDRKYEHLSSFYFYVLLAGICGKLRPPRRRRIVLSEAKGTPRQ